MTKIKCAECGKEDEVPFKPREGSKVLCKECFLKSKGITPREEKPAESSDEEEPIEEGESIEEDTADEEAEEESEEASEE